MLKSIKKNYIYNLLYQILSLLTPLITTPYISRVLGAEKIGIYSYSSSIVSYFALFAAMGMASYGQREVSYYQDDRCKRTETFWNTEILCVITTFIALALYFCFLIFQKTNRFIFALLSVTIVDVCLNISWLLSGMEEFGKIVLRNIIIRVISVIVIFIFVHKPEDLIVYIAANMLVSVISNISLWPLVPKFVDKIPLRKLNPFKNFKSVISMFIPTIAVTVYTVLDKTMIGIITGNSFENGYYEQAMKLSKMALSIITAMGTVMIPRIGFLFEKNDKEKLQCYMYRSYRFAFFLGIPMVIGLFMVSKNLVPWFYGDGYDTVIPLLKILSFLIIAIGISNVTGMQYLVPTKRQNILTLTVCIGAVINFCANMVLIPKYGSMGAAFASVLAETSITIIQLWIVRKELSFFVILKNSIKYFLAGGIMIFCLGIEIYYFSPAILHTFIMVVTGVMVYFFMLLIFRDVFFLENIKSILLKVRKSNEKI